MGTALVGIVLGSFGAYFVGRTMQGMVYGVGHVDPLAFSVVPAPLLAVGAAGLPGPRAPRGSVDPMMALRQE